MAEIRDRLINCFESVFPTLDRELVVAADVNSVEGWDSLANFSLLTVIEEEFELHIPEEDLNNLSSFEAVEKYLTKTLRN